MGMKHAKEFLKEQLDEDPAVWTKKKAKKIEEGLKNFLQNWDLDNIFFDVEQNEEKWSQDEAVSKNVEKEHDNLNKNKQKEFKHKGGKSVYKHKKMKYFKKNSVKERNMNSGQHKDETNHDQNPEVVTINVDSNDHNKKKEYSSWSAA